MFISQHKTSRAGPAPLTITANLKTNIERYITNIRGILANEDEQAIFVTEQGTAFMPGTIGKRVTEWWRKATGKHISSTSLRKMHSSNLINEDDVNKRSAHRLVCHSTRTAEKHYMINRLAESAVQGHKVLAQNINLKDTCSTPLTTSKVESDDNQHPTRTSNLSSKQWDDVHLLFADVIKSNAPLTYTETRNLMSESMDLMEEVRNDVIVAKIYNHVKYLQSCAWNTGLQNVPHQETASKTTQWIEDSASLSQGSSGRQWVWSKHDEDVIAKQFEIYNACPRKSTIVNDFNTIEELKDIASRNGLHRCYEKVKNLFKKRVR